MHVEWVQKMLIAVECFMQFSKCEKRFNSHFFDFFFHARRFLLCKAKEKQHKTWTPTQCVSILMWNSSSSHRHKRRQQISLRDEFKRKRNVNFSIHVAQITTNASLMCLKWSNLCAVDEFSNYSSCGVDWRLWWKGIVWSTLVPNRQRCKQIC